MHNKRHKRQNLYGLSLITLLMALFMFGAIVFVVARGWAASSAQAAAPTGGSTQPFVEPNSPGDWPMYGHDNQRTNYNPDETTINSGNVSQLVQRWQYNVGSNGTAPSNAPSVANGRVYVGSSVATGNDFFAFDAVAGGLPAWSANLNYQSSCFNVGIGSTAAISGSILSVGGGDPAFYGLDATTGA